MAKLDFSRLLKFDLLADAEKRLVSSPDILVKFFEIKQQINAIDRVIRKMPSSPGSTDKILRTELILAVGSTLAIENINLDEEEIEQSFEKAEGNQALARAEQEAENSRLAYKFVIDYSTDNPEQDYTEPVIKQIHKTLTDKIGYQSNTPGEYRNSSVLFGYPPREGLCQTESQVREAMRLFIEWLNSGHEGYIISNSFTKAIAAHYYLTEIHPFSDGNGRTARALEAMVLYRAGVNKYCFWSLANFWSANRDQYIHELGVVGQTSELLEFIMWGLEGYLTEIERIEDKVKRKVERLMLIAYVRYKLEDLHIASTKAKRCLACLTLLVRRFSNGIKLDDFKKNVEISVMYSNLTTQTQRRDINDLFDWGFISLKQEKNVALLVPNYEILEALNYYV